MKSFQSNNIAESDLNYWPGFIDIISSVLMIFILISVMRLVFNVENIESLLIKSKQEIFSKVFTKEFKNELQMDRVHISSSGNLQQIRFSSEILFDIGSAELSFKGKKILDRLGMVFKKTKETASFKQIQVEGHTDDSPIIRMKRFFPTNWELSSQRSINVVKFFTNDCHFKISPNFFSATGYSYYKPVTTRETMKALNRRIEIRLVYFSEFTKGL